MTQPSNKRLLVVDDMTNLQSQITALASPAWTSITGKPSTFPPSAHTHAAADVTSGTFSLAQGGTGGTDATSARTSLGLGSVATLNQIDLTANVTNTLPLGSGGTGATTAAAARTSLGLGSLATLSSVDLTSQVSNTLPIGSGGTASTTASAARTALGITPTNIGAANSSHTHAATDITSGLLAVAQGGTGNSTNTSSSTAALVTASGTVAVSSATAPTTGQALIATSGTAATWQTLPSNTPSDATTSAKGIVQLAGDLAGTAASPTVPGLALKANIASPTFTGTPIAPTATSGTDTTQIATTNFANNASRQYFAVNSVSALTYYPTVADVGTLINAVGGYLNVYVPSDTLAPMAVGSYFDVMNNTTGVPGILVASQGGGVTLAVNTSQGTALKGAVLRVIKTASNTWMVLNASPADASTVAAKANLASPAFTGTPTAPTATAGDSSTTLATTAFVATGLATKANTSHTHSGADITSGTVAIAQGGTGSTTAAAARTALGLGSLSTLSSVDLTSNVANTLPVANGGTGNTAGAASAIVTASGNVVFSTAAAPTAGQTLVATSATAASWSSPVATDSSKLAIANNLSDLNNAGTARTNLGLGSVATQNTVAIANGGTGQTTQQAAINALAGTQTGGTYLRSDGTNTTLSSIQAGDVPTLNQNTTGSAGYATNANYANSAGSTGNFTGTIAVGNGGTGANDAGTARNNLGITPGNIGAAYSSHNHDGSNITSGTVGYAYLPMRAASGVSSSTITPGGTQTITAGSPGTLTLFSGNLGVTFPGGRFSSAPFVSSTPESAAASAQFSTVSRPSTTGFTQYYGRSTSAAAAVEWTAIQA